MAAGASAVTGMHDDTVCPECVGREDRQWWKGVQECVSASPCLLASLSARADAGPSGAAGCPGGGTGGWQAGRDGKEACGEEKEVMTKMTKMEIRLQDARFLEPSDVELAFRLYKQTACLHPHKRPPLSPSPSHASSTASCSSPSSSTAGTQTLFWPPMESSTCYYAPHFPAALAREQVAARMAAPDGSFLLLNFSASPPVMLFGTAVLCIGGCVCGVNVCLSICCSCMCVPVCVSLSLSDPACVSCVCISLSLCAYLNRIALLLRMFFAWFPTCPQILT